MIPDYKPTTLPLSLQTEWGRGEQRSRKRGKGEKKRGIVERKRGWRRERERDSRREHERDTYVDVFDNQRHSLLPG